MLSISRFCAPTNCVILPAPHIKTGLEKIKYEWLTSPYYQIEPAMACQANLPIIILREEDVHAKGILILYWTGVLSGVGGMTPCVSELCEWSRAYLLPPL